MTNSYISFACSLQQQLLLEKLIWVFLNAHLLVGLSTVLCKSLCKGFLWTLAASSHMCSPVLVADHFQCFCFYSFDKLLTNDSLQHERHPTQEVN